jgi:hypothetical protein
MQQWLTTPADTPAAGQSQRPGRPQRTRSNGPSKLTDDVAEMRHRWDSGGVTQRALAAQYGVGKGQVHTSIVRRKQWQTP